ncbi:MAG: HAMP domain-containing histidine kinase [Deltaproteobacteria bacterium]|nr:HAMP domain-containing histidine kinase [Deltaproteobacteria bacterium]NND29031.1 HAMP domain-containing histidine kinase [Myxococcales bacterium]MBT8463962.1 HAMP domain-containing histidine kinase [Deltaproteobacteria bacterium]MBT8480076.1 HAMP domain-containing histidine kinase [Deltaproteobacteria bacterium]NNK07758.1 HAMP domain-containing histidine kinase [Myxococcales bacterium]
MKLRARLAVTLGLAAISLLVLLGWGQSRWQSRIRVDALAEAAVHRMESGGRERCEANPERWPRDRDARRRRRPPGPPERTLPRHRVFAYDANLISANPDSPAFPPDLARQLKAGDDVATQRSPKRRRTEIAVRMPWNEGPCAVLLMRSKGPPPWFSAAVLMPAFLVALVVILVALLAAGPMVRRIRQLTDSVRRIGSDSEEPVHVEGNDEIAELGAAFEQSRRTIEAQLASLREREAALRNYIANTTHDVMLPLSVLQGHLASLQQRIEAGDTLDAKAFVPSLEESQYLGSLLHNLNAVARLEAHEGLSHRDPIDLNRLVERVVDRHQPIAKRKQISLDLAVPETTIEFPGDLTLLEQALGNIVQNAIRYNRADGHVAVILEGSANQWALRVVDDGPGIAPADRERVVEPSFRGSEARTRHPHGMGLGLHIASDVADRHGLRLALRDTHGGGLTVELIHAG